MLRVRGLSQKTQGGITKGSQKSVNSQGVEYGEYGGQLTPAYAYIADHPPERRSDLDADPIQSTLASVPQVSYSKQRDKTLAVGLHAAGNLQQGAKTSRLFLYEILSLLLASQRHRSKNGRQLKKNPDPGPLGV